jgi:hypothetical protein
VLVSRPTSAKPSPPPYALAADALRPQLTADEQALGPHAPREFPWNWGSRA